MQEARACFHGHGIGFEVVARSSSTTGSAIFCRSDLTPTFAVVQSERAVQGLEMMASKHNETER
jgi:hypothetical protein